MTTNHIAGPTVATRFSRRTMLALMASATGGAALLAACGDDSAKSPGATGTGSAARPSLENEKGDLRVFDFAGADTVDLWSPYSKEFPDKAPKWTFTSGDVDVIAKVRSGDVPDMGVVFGIRQSLYDLGVLQPWDPALIPSFPDLFPELTEAGKINGEQIMIPTQWGTESAIFDPSVVDKPDSYAVLFDDAYKGKISWFDNPLVIPTIAALVNGIKDPFNMTDAELTDTKKFLVDKMKNVRFLWSSETDLTSAFLTGDVVVAHAWPSAWAALINDGSKEVGYLAPKEGAYAWLGGHALFADTKNYYHAHKFVDALVSKPAQTWQLNNYASGPSNAKLDQTQLNETFVTAFNLNDPSSMASLRPQPAIPSSTYQRYGEMWSAVKAS